MELKVKISDDEYFWGGDVNSGYDMSICKDSKYNRDFRYNAHNQFMPLLFHLRADIFGVKGALRYG